MAAYAKVTVGRSESYTASGDRNKVNAQITKDYYVDITAADPANYGILDALSAPGVPKLNRSVYTVGGRIAPYLVCRNLRCERDGNKIDRYKVTATFEGSYERNQNPSESADIDPDVTIEIGEIEIAIWDDLTGWPSKSQSKEYLTPTGNAYSQPLIRKIATQILTIKQYENSITYDEMQDRKFRVNRSPYRNTTSLDGSENKWLITDVKGETVEVLIAGIPFVKAMVQHTIVHNPYGWEETRALIDTHFLEGGVKIPFLEGKPLTLTVGQIDENGAKYKPGPDDDKMLYQKFLTYRPARFQDFLQA